MPSGIDTGGTFTDLVHIAPDGMIHTAKVPTDHADHLRSLALLLEDWPIPANDGVADDFFCHGTTLCTNALITGTGARTALLTTRGFRDVLEFKRGHRLADPDHIYDLQQEPPPPLVPRRWRFEVGERVLADGVVQQALEEEEVVELGRQLVERGIEAVAVSYLFSFLNSRHEEMTEKILRERCPGIYLSRSSEVNPVFREYERTNTTVVNAYLGPQMARYLEALRAASARFGPKTRRTMMTSIGGMASLEQAAQRPVDLIMSGPAAGVAAATWLAGLMNRPNVISFDMGGTSCDVCLIENGRATVMDAGDINHYRINCEMIAVHSIGAGGGSIARVDAVKNFFVGPESAGADPGPACYGKGGVAPTVTDAAVVLGYLDDRYFLGGRFPLEGPAARTAITSQVSAPLGFATPEEGAEAVYRLVNANMADAVHEVSVARGKDPRDFTLMAFGGCAPLHAVRVAEQLGIKTVVIPVGNGTLSALGNAVARRMVVKSRSCIRPAVAASLPDIARALADLEGDARKELTSDQVMSACTLFTCYQGQAHDVAVEVDLDDVRAGRLEPILARFHARHEELFSHASPGAPVLFMKASVRLEERRDVAPPRTIPRRGAGEPGLVAHGHRDVWLDGGRVRVDVHRRDRLCDADAIVGPAVVEDRDSTILIPRGYRAEVDAYGNIRISQAGASQ